MKLQKKFPKATRSHGKRAEGGARARDGGGAAEALACRPSSVHGRAGDGERHGAGRSRGAKARDGGHGTDSDARRAGSRLGGAPRTGAGGRRPSPLRRPPCTARPRHWCSARFSFRIARFAAAIAYGLWAPTQIAQWTEKTDLRFEHTTDVALDSFVEKFRWVWFWVKDGTFMICIINPYFVTSIVSYDYFNFNFIFHGIWIINKNVWNITVLKKRILI